jgi:hypothetical protein
MSIADFRFGISRAQARISKILAIDNFWAMQDRQGAQILAP